MMRRVQAGWDAVAKILAVPLVAAVFLVALSADLGVVAVGPSSRALPVEVTGNKNTETIVPLMANVPIPDNGELNWPINVVDLTGITVVDLRVELFGFWHEHASDLRVSVLHGPRSVDLLRNTGGSKSFGRARLPKLPSKTERDFYLNPANTDAVEGDGLTYSWGDFNGTNLALGQPTEQSTTAYGGVSSRAVDGDVRGFYSLDTVTHTGGQGINDPEPWWEVEVGAGHPENVVPIGTIRVWNRVQEKTQSEIQVLEVTASKTISPLDTYSLNFTWNGETYTTEEISTRAVGGLLDETNSTAPGQGRGESLEAKLQALPNLGRVSVTRTGPYDFNGFRYTITFDSEAGNVPSLVANLEGMDPNIVPRVTSTPFRDGSANIWYNYKNEVEEISGRLFPAWVMVSNFSVGGAGLDAAKGASHFRRRLTDDSIVENTIVLPPGISGRYVRVQLEDSDFLSIAEVEVFSERFSQLSAYQGGSPIVASHYQPEFSMVDVFSGDPIHGVWLLSIEDDVPRGLSDGSSIPIRFTHGTGGIHSWAITLTCSDGQIRRYDADVLMTIKTMPFFGTLYKYDPLSGSKGDRIETVSHQERYLGPCYGDCVAQFGVGVPLSTDKDGSVAQPSNRVSVANLHAVVYVPNTDWLGTDKFTYTTLLGVTESPRVDATVHVRKCRINCQNDIFDDFVYQREGVGSIG